jgi:hypothetical protein
VQTLFSLERDEFSDFWRSLDSAAVEETADRVSPAEATFGIEHRLPVGKLEWYANQPGSKRGCSCDSNF